MKTAKFVKDCKCFTGSAKLYELSEPIEYDKHWYNTFFIQAKKTKFVVVSATHAMFSGAETYISPANENGEVTDWGELEGSYRGGLSHAVALEGAGFSVI